MILTDSSSKKKVFMQEGIRFGEKRGERTQRREAKYGEFREKQHTEGNLKHRGSRGIKFVG